jgi:ribosomal protein L37AE/L43A
MLAVFIYGIFISIYLLTEKETTMAKMYWGPDGQPYPRSYGLAAAKRAGSKRYHNPESCPVCGKHICYTKNSKCVQCSRLDAGDFYCYALNLMDFTIDPDMGVIRTTYKTQGGVSPETWNREVSREHYDRVTSLFQEVPEGSPSNAGAAALLGVGLYVHPEPCPDSGHMHLRTIEGKCFLCEQEKLALSPRQEAIKAGEKWYTPDTPCPICGGYDLRRVDNGRWQGCHPGGTSRGTADGMTPEQIMMKSQPDLILPKAQAKALGLKVYRTGKPCRRGHNGYRYASTGNCIECHKGRGV